MDLKPYIISETATIIEAMSAIDRNSEGVVFICKDDAVIATLTDGDVRRHILKSGSLAAPAIEAANTNFKYIQAGKNVINAKKEISDKTLRAFPVLDDKMRLVEIVFPNIIVSANNSGLNLPVIIMAGGKGTRLYPYTRVLPKPLIPIGDLTITEHIMNEFTKYGCSNFTMIVNYKKNIIKAFFADCDTGYNVSFIDEDSPLGTGGGLRLLKGNVDSAFFVTNCDILVFENYSKIYEHHKNSGNLLTMLCVTKRTEFPYGTVEIDNNGSIKSIMEKPSFSFLSNAGFYLLEPEFLEYIPEDQFIHMTDIIQRCIDSGGRVGVYPISEEQWSDMGNPEEMEKMRERFIDEDI